MEIRLNGEERQTESSTLQEFLSELGFEGKRVAVELNKEIVPREMYKQVRLSAGDCLEVVHFVGGG
jgi:thiamine biosynthesis protein ThiS